MQTSLLSDGRNKEFLLPVDTEYKATVFRPWVFRGVHMLAFHAAWLSLFVSFFSTFAPAALSVTIRDDLDLTDEDILHADVAAVAGTISSRILLGSVCDSFGPRLAHSVLLVMTSLGVFFMAIVRNAVGYIICRLIVGLSLGTFVACQYWSSVVFNVRIIGRANATGAGAGNGGAGVVQAIMPLVYLACTKAVRPFIAWRMAMLVPGILQNIVALFILTATQDLPDGSFKELLAKGEMKRSSSTRSWLVALRNYRVWLCALGYGLTFGVELAIENVATTYFFDNFPVNYTVAGLLGCIYGTLNFVTRPLAGTLSDMSSGPYGMRGRLMFLCMLQFLGSVFLILLFVVRNSLVLTCLLIVLTAFGIQGSQAAIFAIVPFVSKRSLGVVNGIVGAGGNVGATIISFIFFDKNRFETASGFLWTGITVAIASTYIFLFNFPMWGGIFCNSIPGADEVDYYLAEYTREEIIQGKADRSVRFSVEAQSQRGSHRHSQTLLETYISRCH